MPLCHYAIMPIRPLCPLCHYAHKAIMSIMPIRPLCHYAHYAIMPLCHYAIMLLCPLWIFWLLTKVDVFLEMEIYFRKRGRISGNGNVFLNMEMDFRKLFPCGKYIEFPGNSNNASYASEWGL